MIIDNSPNPAVIRAAGGIVWTVIDQRPCVAVIHRPKYHDWSLPKGKLKEGESWEEAAIREVREETGCRVRVIGFAGSECYLVRGRPKVVLFWNMEMMEDCGFKPSREVDRMEWLVPADAILRLDHPVEKRLLHDAGQPWEGVEPPMERA